MPEINVSQEINAPAAKVWALIADYGDIQAWWPKEGPVQIARVENEGQGVGMIRHIYNHGFPEPISEQLDYLDPEMNTWKLSIVRRMPPGMIAYSATGNIVETDSSSCRVDYKGVFSTDPGKEAEVEQFLRMAYALMFKGLKTTAES